jgi:hypothetical protein
MMGQMVQACMQQVVPLLAAAYAGYGLWPAAACVYVCHTHSWRVLMLRLLPFAAQHQLPCVTTRWPAACCPQLPGRYHRLLQDR